MSNNFYFVGFSTLGAVERNRQWVLYDIDLIKQDLLNHFYTKKGERLMRPTFGCSIWQYIGEQMSVGVQEAIQNEVTRIINLDTRLVTRSVTVDGSEHSIIVVADIYYRPYDMVDQFKLTFDARQ